MESLKQFGLDPILLGAQIVNFLIIFFILRKYLYKPVLTILKKRQDVIEEGIKKAEESRLLYEKATQKEKEILKQAQLEAKKIIDEAKKQHDEILKQTQLDTKKQTESMLQEAKAQIAYETRETEKRLATHISELTVMFLQKSLSGFFTEKEQGSIIKNAIRKMKEKAD